MKPTLASVVLRLLLATTPVQAQGVGSSGVISGTVTDASGAVLPKAAVTALDIRTGMRRSAQTDSTGQFQLIGLSPATYAVTAQVAGFGIEIRKGVVVGLGQTVISDFQMKISTVSTMIEVMGEPPVVETERGSQANNVNEEYIHLSIT